MVFAKVEIEAVERDKKDAIEDVIISCGSCQIDLVQFIIMQPTDEENHVQAVCPRCGDKSFLKIIKGKGYIGACRDDVEIVDIKWAAEGNINNILVELQNVKK